MSGLTWVVDFLCVVVGSSSVMVVYLTVLNQKASLFVYESTIYATSVSSMLRVVIHRTSVLFKISSSRQQEMALLRAVIGTTFASLTFNLKHVNYNIFRTMGPGLLLQQKRVFFLGDMTIQKPILQDSTYKAQHFIACVKFQRKQLRKLTRLNPINQLNPFPFRPCFEPTSRVLCNLHTTRNNRLVFSRQWVQQERYATNNQQLSDTTLRKAFLSG